MTCIAWDGKILAADKRMVNAGLASTTTKIFRDGKTVLAFSGDADGGHEIMRWYTSGADEKAFPARQRSEKDWTLLVIVKGGALRFYERTPCPIFPEDKFWACGSGRDYALAAMHCGKSAREAVQIASLFDTGCGNGVDWFKA